MLVMQYTFSWERELLGFHGSHGVLWEWKRKCCWELDGMGMAIRPNVMQMRLAFSQWHIHHRYVICNSEFWCRYGKEAKSLRILAMQICRYDHSQMWTERSLETWLSAVLAGEQIQQLSWLFAVVRQVLCMDSPVVCGNWSGNEAVRNKKPS